MLANYHTHTVRCGHAHGSEREYVENALRAGLEILGFSDHSPVPFPAWYHSNVRMSMEQLPEYVDTILALRREYAGRIQIPLGLELEYYPKYLPELVRRLRELPVDYLICGQHFIPDEVDGWAAGRGTADIHDLRAYCRRLMEAMNSGLYTYMAHPDMLRWLGDRETYQQEMAHVCREARDCGLPLEINLLGVWESRSYPFDPFWETAAREGCPVILGRDAHRPEALLDTASEEKALDIVRKYDLKLLQKAELRKI